MSDGAKEVQPLGRMVVQQCVSAKLQLNAEKEEELPVYAKIGQGIVIYICFMVGATSATVDKMAKCVCNIKLSKSSSSLTSVLDLPGDILVVPQATLGGKQKGNRMQYHSNIEKSMGEELYNLFISRLEEKQQRHDACKRAGVKTKCGTYGNLQVLSVETNGPYTHLFSF